MSGEPDDDLWGPEEADWANCDADGNRLIAVTGTPAEQAEAIELAREAEIQRIAEKQALWHEGNQRGRDLAAAREAKRQRQARATPLDWKTFLTERIEPPKWFVGRLLGHAQHAAVVGSGKVGKSLVILDMAYRIVSGGEFLGDAPRRPMKVLYVDQENGRYDIQSRLLALGAKPAQLELLTYMSFPSFRPLDTPAGAADLVAEVDGYHPDLVILDTISRMIEGKENDSDPWRDMYRLFIIEMKRREIGSLRLDHFGKDIGKGGRGSSAKDQDVDAVWELKAADGGENRLSLVRTHTRSGIGPSAFDIERQGELVGDQWRPGATRHVVVEPAADRQEFIVAGMIADQLEAAGIGLHLSRDKVRAAIKANHSHIRCTNEILMSAINIRKQRARGS